MRDKVVRPGDCRAVESSDGVDLESVTRGRRRVNSSSSAFPVPSGPTERRAEALLSPAAEEQATTIRRQPADNSV